MDALTLEEHGALSILSDLIVMNHNELVLDNRFLAGIFRCDVRVCKRLVNALLVKAGFYLHTTLSGQTLLRSHETDEIVDAALARLTAAREAGLKSGYMRKHKSAPVPKKDKWLNGTVVETTARTTDQASVSTMNSSLRSPKDYVESAAQNRTLEDRLGKPLEEWFWKDVEVDEPLTTVTFPSKFALAKALQKYDRVFDDLRLRATCRERRP